jgi:hypothetical protein
MNPQESYVSVIEPISPAIEHVKTVLFRPFDLGRWFIIGFCAWLASLGRPGGGGGGGGRSGGRIEGAPAEFRNMIEDVAYHIPVAVFIGVLVFVLVVALWLLVTWLSSRGRFMFLYCVAQNKAEVKKPWHLFRGYAGSLFAFRIVVGVLGFLAVAAFVIPALVTVYVLKVALGSTALSILGVVVYVAAFVAVILVLAAIGKFTKDFIVPIMYLHGLSCRQAWAVFLDQLAPSKLRLVLYLLFQVVLQVAIVTIVVALSCATCCIAGCVFMVPYVGTVALLPIITFERAYSLYYLAQYGPQFNVFIPGPEVQSISGPTA